MSWRRRSPRLPRRGSSPGTRAGPSHFSRGSSCSRSVATCTLCICSSAAWSCSRHSPSRTLQRSQRFFWHDHKMNFRYGPCELLGLLGLCPWSGVPLPVAATVPLAPGEQLDHRVDPEEVFVHPGPPLEPVPVSFLDVGEEVPQTRRKPIPDWTRPDCGHVHVFGGLQRDRLVSDLELPQPPDFLLEHVLRERHDGRQHAGEDVFVTVRIATARCMSDQ